MKLQTILNSVLNFLAIDIGTIARSLSIIIMSDSNGIKELFLHESCLKK